MAKKKALPQKQLDSRALEAAAEAVADGSAKEGEVVEVENWAADHTSDQYEAAGKIAEKIQKCFDNKQGQNDKIDEYWNIYNAQPDDNVQYSGNNTCYVPAVRDCINARTKRTLAQLFPASHKHVDAVGPDALTPYAQLSLLEHYIRSTNLKNIVRADLIAGDVTGQWNLYVDWAKHFRAMRELVKKPRAMEDGEGGEMPLLDPDAEDDEELEDKEVITEGPDIVALATEDVAIYPPTVDNADKAIATAVRLRMSEDMVLRFMEEGVFAGIEGDDPFEEIERMMKSPDLAREKVTPSKRRTADAYIRTEGTYKYLLVHEIHTTMKLDGERKEPVYIYAVRNLIIGIIRNPLWSGKTPLVSAPIEKQTGSYFGISKIEPVKFLQWNLNDYWNMGMDSAQYSLLPIVMTDPLKSPQYASMTMGLAAVWLADPNSTKFATFPQLWKDQMQLCAAIKSQIQESMDVNEAMIGKMPQGRKNNQAVGAMQQEQQTNIIDHAKTYEDTVLNKVLELVMEMDRQFRTESITVKTMGDVGTRARITEIDPQQFGVTYFYQWAGTAYTSNLQRMQQMISWANVLRGMPPEVLNGRKLDLTPLLEFGTEQIFGPDLAPRILIDERNMYTVPPDMENTMMHNGMLAVVHTGDNDVEHMQSHNESAVLTGDPRGLIRQHIADHNASLQAKQQKAMGPQGGAQGVPGGAGPGVPGSPRPGAMPAPQRPVQNPPGAIQQDNMAGAPGRG